MSSLHTYCPHAVSSIPLFLGEGKGYKERAFLLYDGIHYDPLVLCGASEEVLQTRFPVQEKNVVEQAVQLARDAYQV